MLENPENGSKECLKKAGKQNRVEKFYTYVTFRLTGIPYNAKGEELRLELNKIGLNLKSLASLSRAL